MQIEYLLVGILLVVSGVVSAYAYIKFARDNYHIREGGRKYEAQIVDFASVKHKSVLKLGFPVFEMEKNPKMQLRSVRSMFIFGNQKRYEGKVMTIIYDSTFPKQCTHGSTTGVVIESLLFIGLAGFMTFLGLQSIFLFLTSFMK